MTPEQHDERESLITATFVAVAVFAGLCAVCSGDESELLARAKAAIAIQASLHNEASDTGGTDAPETAVAPKASRPVVYAIYSPSFCPPCNDQKRDVKDWTDAPFDVKPLAGQSPIPIEGYPTTLWRVNGVWWSFSGWHGRKHLESEWKRSQDATVPKASRTSGGAVTSGNKSTVRSGGLHWTYPGSIEHHLRTTHGQNVTGLTREQMLDLHDRLHEGR